MTTKTITLELDAYEKLTLAKRAGESFSEVIRRAGISATPPTGAKLRAYFRAGGSGVSGTYLSPFVPPGARAPERWVADASGPELWRAAFTPLHRPNVAARSHPPRATHAQAA